MENKPVVVSVQELLDLAHRLRKLADACDVAVRQMQTDSRTDVLASGQEKAEQSLMVLHGFVNSAIGEAFNPTVPLETDRRKKSYVIEKRGRRRFTNE